MTKAALIHALKREGFLAAADYVLYGYHPGKPYAAVEDIREFIAKHSPSSSALYLLDAFLEELND